MNVTKIPTLSKNQIDSYFLKAEQSERRRFPKILHNHGNYQNEVFNFILEDSYMQPHLHPSKEKIEKMHLIQGSFALITFDNDGEVINIDVLEKGGRENIYVPAFTWHTYVMLSKKTIVFETMEGIYSPDTWKKMASWSPSENTQGALSYLEILKNKVN